MDEAAHQLRGRELPRLLGRWLLAGVLPTWVVLTALAYEWGAPVDGEGGGQLGDALATSTAALLIVLLLAAPVFLLGPMLRRERRVGLHPEDTALLAAEIAGAPVRVRLVQGAASLAPVEPARARVPVQAPRPAMPAPSVVEPPAPVAPTEGAEAAEDDVDALFR